MLTQQYLVPITARSLNEAKRVWYVCIVHAWRLTYCMFLVFTKSLHGKVEFLPLPLYKRTEWSFSAILVDQYLV